MPAGDGLWPPPGRSPLPDGMENLPCRVAHGSRPGRVPRL